MLRIANLEMAPNLKNLTLGAFAQMKIIYGKQSLISIIINIYFM